jgi:membrane protein
MPDAIRLSKLKVGAVINTSSGGCDSESEQKICSILTLLWVYYSSQILLFGAEFTQVYADQAGREVKPNEYAVRVQTKEVERR